MVSLGTLGLFFYLFTLYLGGFGFTGIFINFLILIFSIFFFLSVYVKSKKLIFPKGLYVYLIFLVLLFLNTNIFFAINFEIDYFVLYLSGGLIWISVYNCDKNFKHIFRVNLVLLGLFFASLYLFNLLLSKPFQSSLSLFSGTTINQNNIGIVWAVIFIFFINDTKLNKFMITALSIFFILFSMSRSTYLSVISGAAYLALHYKAFIPKFKYYIFPILGLLISVLVISSRFSSIAMYRIFYMEKAIYSILKNPEGIGVGNFSLLFINGTNVITTYEFSSLAHNIILEFLVGMGVLGISFLIWFIYTILDVIKNTSERNLKYASSLIVLAVSFCFDITYAIPTLVLLFFTLLGLINKEERYKLTKTK